MAGGVHDRGCAWWGHAWQGACMAGGMHGSDTCVVGGMCGKEGMRGTGGMHGKGGMHGRGVQGRYYEIRSMSGRRASY